jgi:hypothetical protein
VVRGKLRSLRQPALADTPRVLVAVCVWAALVTVAVWRVLVAGVLVALRRPLGLCWAVWV